MQLGELDAVCLIRTAFLAAKRNLWQLEVYGDECCPSQWLRYLFGRMQWRWASCIRQKVDHKFPVKFTQPENRCQKIIYKFDLLQSECIGYFSTADHRAVTARMADRRTTVGYSIYGERGRFSTIYNAAADHRSYRFRDVMAEGPSQIQKVITVTHQYHKAILAFCRIKVVNLQKNE